MIGAISSIKIKNPVGSEYYSNASQTSTDFPVTDQCERSAKLMGDDYVRLQFKLYDKITFDAFSYIEYNNQTFFLREQYIPTPNGTKIEDGGSVSSAYYTYDLKFVSVANMLDKHVCYRHVKVGEQEWYEPEININGNLSTMYVIVIGAIKRAAIQHAGIHYGKLLGTIYTNGIADDGINPNLDNVKLTSDTKLLTFNFSGDNIANVCTTIANNFTTDDKKDTEWYITENNGLLILHFAKCQEDDAQKEQSLGDYVREIDGRCVTSGLKKVEYAQAWSGVPQRIVPFGSDRNMSENSVKAIDEITQMQSVFGKRLRLHKYEADGQTLKTYSITDTDGTPITISVDENGALENAFVNTGIEQVQFFDDIYPQGHFRVSSVSVRNKRQDGETIPEYTIEALPIDTQGELIKESDLTNNGFYPIKIEEGTTLSVRFEKGLLNGREFQISNKTTTDDGGATYSMKFTIVADGSIEDGTLIPSGNFKPNVDDEFALFNMKMPEVYIEQAERELAQRAYNELVKLQTTRPEVKCTTDPTIFNGDIAFGKVINVHSELFNTEGYIFKSRVISYSYKLTQTSNVQFSLASAIMQGTLASMNNAIADVTHTTSGLEQRALNLSRRAWRDASEMAEMLDSIRTEMMVVGEEKYQFTFSMPIECKYAGGLFIGLEIGSGVIQHTQSPYIEYVNSGLWSVGNVILNSDVASQSLDANKPYYLYAMVGNDNLPAQMILSENAYSKDIDKDVEYLLLGILSSEFERERVFNRTNGFSSIAGGTITTEQIQDASRNLIIDFQRNRIVARNGAEIVGNIKFIGNDGSYKSLYEMVGGNVGGVNLLKKSEFDITYNTGEMYKTTPLMTIEKGKTYVGQCDFVDNAPTIDEWAKGVHLRVGNQGYKFGEPIVSNSNATLYLIWADKDYVDYVVNGGEPAIANSTFTQFANKVMIQEGSIATAYQPPVEEVVAKAEEQAMESIIPYIEELQSQIDGEVTSWFYPTAPIDENENVRTDVVPISDWLKSYTLTGGVYVLNQGALNELINHLGDTYTNTENFVDNDSTPLAGQSWRWCDATNTTPLPAGYIRVKYEDVEKKLHWHKIADNDALKALEAASKAQATADGKAKIFTSKPEGKQYKVGDMWILESDNVHPNGKVGDIFNAIKDNTTYNSADWEKHVRYVDETILDDVIVGGRNLLRGSKELIIAASQSASNYVVLQPTRALEPSTNYVFSIDKSEMLEGSDTAFTLYIFSSDITSARQRVNIPISNTRQVVKFTTSTSVTSTDVVLLYAGQQGSTAGNSVKFTCFKLEKGNAGTEWSPAPEDVDDAISAAESKAEALGYLEDVLQPQNTTTITGGLAMTNLLLLKSLLNVGDTEPTITAGMSGITDDNILLWGNGTYEDAVCAKNNNYYKGNGSLITTLLKKDGTGKLGIFVVDDTKAVVDTDYGKVVIDTKDGVLVYDDTDTCKAALSPKNISVVEKDIISEFKKIPISINYNQQVQQGMYMTKVVLWKESNKNYQYANMNGTIDIDVTCKVDAYMATSDVHRIYVRALGLSLKSVDFDRKYFGGEDDTYFTIKGSGTIVDYDADNVELEISIIAYGDNPDDSPTPTITFDTSVPASVKVVADIVKTITMQNQQYTIMGKDGFLCRNNSNMFKVLNQADGKQKIFAKGLSDGSDRVAGSGELYVTSSFVDAFVSFLDEFYLYVDHVRTIGSNAGNADTMQDKIEEIKNTLVDASGNRITDIIASS